jgi:hypothetical protein
MMLVLLKNMALLRMANWEGWPGSVCNCTVPNVPYLNQHVRLVRTQGPCESLSHIKIINEQCAPEQTPQCLYLMNLTIAQSDINLFIKNFMPIL